MLTVGLDCWVELFTGMAGITLKRATCANRTRSSVGAASCRATRKTLLTRVTGPTKATIRRATWREPNTARLSARGATGNDCRCGRSDRHDHRQSQCERSILQY